MPLIVSHMFVFYFGIMADLTPPVALAAFAAASIAKASAMKIGWKATQIRVAGFVVPFMAVYDSALMLQGAPMERLTLAHSPYTWGYELCLDRICRPLTDHLPGIEETGTIVLAPCER